jgi:hypothetical protein
MLSFLAILLVALLNAAINYWLTSQITKVAPIFLSAFLLILVPVTDLLRLEAFVSSDPISGGVFIIVSSIGTCIGFFHGLKSKKQEKSQ